MNTFFYCVILCIFTVCFSINLYAKEKDQCIFPQTLKFIEPNQHDLKSLRAITNNYMNEYWAYRKCSDKQAPKNNDSFKSYLDDFISDKECPPTDLNLVFNEWPTNVISERKLHAVNRKCSQGEYQLMDILLNAVWAHIKKINEGTIPSVLLTSQRNWLKFSNSACKFTALDEHNPRYKTLESACRVRVLKSRIIELSAWIYDEDDFGWPASSLKEITKSRVRELRN